MRWVALGLIAITLSVGATFDSCISKNRLAFVQKSEFIAIAISNDRLLVPFGLLDLSLLPNDWKVVNRDFLTGLAIVETNHTALPVQFRSSTRFHEHDKYISILPNESFEATIKQHQYSLCGARLDRPIRSSSIICAPCYAVMGVGVLGRFVESDYVLHLIHSKAPFYWGDLGFRFYDKSNKIEFLYRKDLGLNHDDEIISISDLNSTNRSKLEKKILLLQPDTNVTVGFKRDGEIKTVDLIVQKRSGGGLLGDTFLEDLGWQFTQDLFVYSVQEGSYVGSKNIKIGDRLIGINGIKVANSYDVRVVLKNAGKKLKLLIERDEFQFFVVIDNRL